MASPPSFNDALPQSTHETGMASALDPSSSSSSSSSSFRVLIAGGSVVGLTLANALDKAGVDYLVLEKRDIGPELGAAIGLISNTARVFEQLGVYQDMKSGGVPLTSYIRANSSGRLIEDCKIFERVAAHTKRSFYFLRRKSYIDVLYGNLGDKTKVRARCGVASYVEHAEGVTVTTTTGEVVEGSILVGCDGVNSRVRQLIAEQFLEKEPQRAKGLIEAFTCEYAAIFGTTPNEHPENPKQKLVPEGVVVGTFHDNISTAISSGVPGATFWFVFIKLDQQTTMPNCPRFTEADAEAAAEKHGHLLMGPGLTVKEVWENRTRASMVAMQNGILQVPWHNDGRVVLLGDSVTKSTANAGLGGNTNIEAVCHFANELVALLRSNRAGLLPLLLLPTTAQVTSVFARYEAAHRPRAEKTVSISNFVTRFDALDGRLMRVLKNISPWVPDSWKARMAVNWMASAPVLEYLPLPEDPLNAD